MTKNHAYYVVRTAYHFGGVASAHKSLKAAQRAAKRYHRKCRNHPCCDVVAADDLWELPGAAGHSGAQAEGPYEICLFNLDFAKCRIASE